MRHKRKGRQLGRSSSHRKALFRNLMTALVLTEREEAFYEGLVDPYGKPVNAPTQRGRIVTTLHKAKEVKPMMDRAITIAKKALPHQTKAKQFATNADRNSQAWKQWRESDNYKKWVAASAPIVNARRRVFSMLRSKEAVQIVFDVLAPRFAERQGGYTRVMRMANPRLGDNGIQAILEFVGKHERVGAKASPAPALVDDAG